MQFCENSLFVLFLKAMNGKTQNEKILFGLKVKRLRQRKRLSFAELSEQAEMSVSYLNEIEKGKKYPKEAKIKTLAAALGVSYDYLIKGEVDETLAPVAELLQSNFLHELPLDLFGIELAKVVEIIANAPARVGAFISTLLELSRNYALREENFYFGALRSYLELHSNYFPELEAAVNSFTAQYELPEERPLAAEHLARLLTDKFNYRIIDSGLDVHPELAGLRSVFLPQKQELLLSSRLTPMQKAFQFGKELGFQHLGITERAYTSSILRGRVFEEVLNHSKAIYFSVALHMPLESFCRELEDFFRQPTWDGQAWLDIMDKYNASPEMFYHRLTNILPEFFGLKKIFFTRFVHDLKRDSFEIDRELHLNHRHAPHGNGLFEHYCRRWIPISLLRTLQERHQGNGNEKDIPIVDAQLSRYMFKKDDYLCLSIARAAYPEPDKNVSVTLGLLLNDDLKKKVAFWQDKAIAPRNVHTTCERCADLQCTERAAAPVIVERRDRIQRMEQALQSLEQ